MKKFIAILLVVATMILCLTACGGKKATAVVTFDSDDVTLLPTGGMKNIGVQIEHNHIMTVNVGSEGVYTFPIMVDGTAYDFTITNENGNITVEAIDGVTFSVR